MKTRSQSKFYYSGFQQIIAAMRHEIRLIFSDAGVLIILFAVPLIYPVLYSFIYYPEVVRDLPIAVFDESASAQSRSYLRNLDATPEVSIAAHVRSMDEAARLFREGKVRGIVQIPSTFSDDIALGRQATVSAYADMEFFLYYKALVTGASFVTLETGRNIQIRNLTKTGYTERQAEVTAEPLKLVENAMANPSGGFASYGIPAALILIIQQTLVLAIGIIAGSIREKQSGSVPKIIEYGPGEIIRQLIGKAVVYFLIYAVLCQFMLGLIPSWFGYPRYADFIEIGILITPFLLSSIFLGQFLSVFFKNRESAMLLYLFTSIPLLFLSGVIWPLSNFSPLWQMVRALFPSSDAMTGYIKLNSLGAATGEISKETGLLWVMTAAYFVLAFMAHFFIHIRSKHLREEVIGTDMN